MKHITKLLLLAILVVFASCQNETLTEGASSIAEEELEMENEILVSDGEEIETFVLNQDLNAEMPARELSFSLSSDLSSGSSESCTPDLEALELSLPETITVNITENPAEDAYFSIDILGDNYLSGNNIKAWCIYVDLDLGVEEALEFDV